MPGHSWPRRVCSRTLRILGQALIALIFGSSLAQASDELLAADDAFSMKATAVSKSRIIFQWEIADGYYMYRDNFKFAVLSPDTSTLGEPAFETGKIKEDALFGDVEVYEGTTTIEVPVNGTDKQLQLEVIGQGCNEPVGVCYPPLRKTVSFDLVSLAAKVDSDSSGLLRKVVDNTTNQSPDAADTRRSPLAGLLGLDAGDAPAMNPTDEVTSDAPRQSIDSLDSLKSFIGDDSAEFLDVDDAFKLELNASDNGVLGAHFVAADGYYLYRNQIQFTASNAALGTPEFPAGVEKSDETYGETTVYYGAFDVPVSILSLANDAGPLSISATYQGCAENAICYPPVTKEYTVGLPATFKLANLNTGADNTSFTTTGGASSDNKLFAGKTFWSLILASFGVGLLLTFTPCVLPLIPILSGIIAGQGENVTRTRGGLLAIAYVLGTAVTYAAIGAVAGATGEQLQAYFQNVWAIGIIAAIFALMSLSMFGLFELEMPSFIQSRLQSRTQTLGGGVLGGTFVLGMASALIVGACVSPLLIAALSVAIAAGDPYLGAAMMVAMALGMGVFLILIGYGAGALIPRAGMWMDRVKYGFGVMLLAVAIYLLTAIPAVPVLFLWAVLLIVVAVYLGATQALPESASGWRYLFKGFGTVMLLWGVVALIGGLGGNRDILNPLPNLTSTTPGKANQAHAGAELFTRVNNVAEFEKALGAAQSEGRYVLLDYYADWCVDCKRMEANTFVQSDVKCVLDDRFALLQVDVTDPTDAERSELKKRFGVFGPPAILFFDPDGKETGDRLYGYRTAPEFLQILSQVTPLSANSSC